jgi:2-aminomuconate deaminase
MSAQGHVVAGSAAPLGRYPHAKVAGDLIYVSGTSSRRPDGSHRGVSILDGVIVKDVAEQARGTLENIERILRSVGAELSDLVQVTTYLVDMADFAAYNSAYAEYFSEAAPTRTTVAVRALPHPDLLIEIQAVAYKPGDADE